MTEGKKRKISKVRVVSLDSIFAVLVNNLT